MTTLDEFQKYTINHNVLHVAEFYNLTIKAYHIGTRNT